MCSLFCLNTVRQLTDPGTPVLIIIRALQKAKWKKGPSPSEHTADSELFFGEGNFVQRKPYLQCLVILSLLRERGLASLPSTESVAYYRLVLRSSRPAEVQRGQIASHYAALMDTSLGPAALCAFEDEVSDVQDDVSDDESSVSGDVDCDLPPVGDVASAPVMANGDGVVVESPSGGQRTVDASAFVASLDESECQLLVASRLSRKYHPQIPGITFEEHNEPGQRGHYKRLTIACPQARVGGDHCGNRFCCKRRGLGANQMKHFGPLEPEAYLAVWAANAHKFKNARKHKRWSPSVGQVRAFMRMKGWIS